MDVNHWQHTNLGSRGRETESSGFLAKVSERRLLGNWLDSTCLSLLLVTVRCCRWLHLGGSIYTDLQRRISGSQVTFTDGLKLYLERSRGERLLRLLSVRLRLERRGK